MDVFVLHTNESICPDTITSPSALLMLTTAKTHQCPVCGWEASSYEGVQITIEPYTGIYCLRCWAKHLAETLPCMNAKE